MRASAAAALLILLASAAQCETNFTALTPEERAVLHSEIRAVLLQNPELVRPSTPAPQEIYADDIANDLVLIDANAAELFDPMLPHVGPNIAFHQIALITEPDCPDCARAERDLRALAETYGVRVNLLNASDHADLAARLEVDTLPFYVFPKMMLRGYMPAAVLKRYLEQGTGQ